MARLRAPADNAPDRKQRRSRQLPVIPWMLAGAAGAGIGAALMAAPTAASADTGADAAHASPSSNLRSEEPSARAGKPASSLRSGRAIPAKANQPGTDISDTSTAHSGTANLIRLTTPVPAAAANNPTAPSAPKPSTSPIVATIGVGASPKGVVVSPDGKTAYVLNTASNTVSVINVADNTKTKDIDLKSAQGSTALTISADGKNVYVTSTSQKPKLFALSPPNPLLSVIDTSTNTVTNSTEIDSLGINILKPIQKSPNAVAVSNGTVFVTSALRNTPSYKTSGSSNWGEYALAANLVSEILDCSSQRCAAYGATESVWSKIQRHTPSLSSAIITGANKLAAKFFSAISGGYIDGDFSGLQTAPVDIGIAPTAGRNLVYSVNSANDFVYVFDPVKRTMVDAVFLGTMKVTGKTLSIGMNTVPTKIRFGGEDEAVAYVLNSGSRELVRLNIDPANIDAGRGVQIIDRVQLNNNVWIEPVDMAISRDGKYAYIINKQAVLEDPKDRSNKKPVSPNILTVVNLTDKTVTQTVLPIDGSTQLASIAVTEDKAFITTTQNTLIRSLAAQIAPSAYRNNVLVVDLAKVTQS